MLVVLIYQYRILFLWRMRRRRGGAEHDEELQSSSRKCEKDFLGSAAFEK
jgi:hypothetical protein